MSREDMRMAIAFTLGWTYSFGSAITMMYPTWWLGGEQHLEGPPDYLDDLNEMQEAEEKIPPGLLVKYYAKLRRICERDKWNAISAFPDQRAEAYLAVVWPHHMRNAI